jgi:hypothetical protein
MINEQVLEVDLWEKNFSKRVAIILNFGIEKSFRNLKEIKHWAEKERGYYSDIFGLNSYSNHDIYRNIKQVYQDIIVNIDDEYHRINQKRGEIINSWDDFVPTKVISLISEYYGSMTLISSESKEAMYLKDLKEKDYQLVESAFRYFTNKANNNSEIAARAAIAIFEYEHDIVDIKNVERDTVFSIIKELRDEKDSYLQEITLLRDGCQKLKREIDILKTESEQKFNEAFSRYKTRMSDSEVFYEKKLAVKSAVEYWIVKANNHQKVAFVFAFCSLFVMSACVGYSSYAFNALITGSFQSKIPIFTESGALQLWVYALLGIIATITFWVLRLFVRIALSNLHLATDAHERATMIKTYLAFEREDKVLDKDDKALILPTIFRAGSTGIVKDDSAPMNPWTLFTRK